MSRALLYCFGIVLLLEIGLSGCAGEPDATQAADADAPHVYDEQADAREQIDNAVRAAAQGDKRVLLVFGGNWCGWCVKLHQLFDDNETIGQLLDQEYTTAWIDVDQVEKHADLGQQYSQLIDDHGVPFLAVLTADGKQLTTQDSGELEKDDHHDPEKVLAFLKEWMAPPVDAEQVLADAQARAASQDKSVFVRFGTPTCGWCRIFDNFWKEQTAILDRDYVPLKIDLVRMSHGQEVATRLGYKKGTGVPWSAIVDADGQVLATSDGPQGNMGFPGKEEEMEHFVTMLTKTKRRNDGNDIEQLVRVLRNPKNWLKHAEKQSAAKPRAAADAALDAGQ